MCVAFSVLSEFLQHGDPNNFRHRLQHVDFSVVQMVLPFIVLGGFLAAQFIVVASDSVILVLVSASLLYLAIETFQKGYKMYHKEAKIATALHVGIIEEADEHDEHDDHEKGINTIELGLVKTPSQVPLKSLKEEIKVQSPAVKPMSVSNFKYKAIRVPKPTLKLYKPNPKKFLNVFKRTLDEKAPPLLQEKEEISFSLNTSRSSKRRPSNAHMHRYLEAFDFKKLIPVFTLLLALVFLHFLRAALASFSFTGIERCSVSDFALLALFAVLVFLLTIIATLKVRAQSRDELEKEQELTVDHVDWDASTILKVLSASVLGGIVS